MLTYKRNGLIIALTCGTSLLTVGKVQAAIININLTSPVATAAGNTITLNGVLTDTTASTVFLNAANINLAGFPPMNIDPAPFFINAPISLNAGSSTANIGLFNVTVPNPFASGAYSGTFTLLGGASGASQTSLGSANFTIQVGSAPAGVPEPTSAALVAIGAAFLVARRRRLRKRWEQTCA